jgi:glutamate synthase domain-containing protein 3
LTGSPRAAWVLEHWSDAQPQFIKVFPHEYKRVLGVERAAAVYASPILPSSMMAAEAKSA